VEKLEAGLFDTTQSSSSSPKAGWAEAFPDMGESVSSRRPLVFLRFGEILFNQSAPFDFRFLSDLVLLGSFDDQNSSLTSPLNATVLLHL
jgi:hypothetical protein